MGTDLHGRIAVVTGASRGIGLAVVRALAADGAFVIAGARKFGPELDEVIAAGRVRCVTTDLTDPAAPAELVAAAGERIDILVNNVGGAPPRTAGFLAVTDEQWQTTLELNLLAAVRTTRAVLPAMLATGGGSIVTIGSVNASLPEPLVVDYSAAKAAVTAFTKAVSKEYGPQGIRANIVSPGPVATDLWLAADGVAATVGRTTGSTPEEVAAGASAAMVTGRFSTPEEVAALVLTLARDLGGNITGAEFRIDGGYVPTW
ncbi:SDR family NAD(P)-dependent oxidoreductase [Nocardia sp. alder85J]|uniref:SDR family NAD(P)-dependent oxidoreductase n=1 Tax=Nocardia sp. alder85J TaxID=2862949 RepID=UPI001CD75422|nr:SDR family oxidoreductase [Nocardia sp. alder85J]MCX4098533.1 SDR family oxidoreductase [Nocardia sp. alder85J]